MISSGRYGYHRQDIAEIEKKPKPLNAVDKMRLEQMKREVAEFEQANPGEAKRIQAL